MNLARLLCTSLAPAVAALALAGCQTTGPYKNEPPPPENTQWEELVDVPTSKVAKRILRGTSGEPMWVTFAGLENKGEAPFGATLDDVEGRIEEYLGNSQDEAGDTVYRMIASEVVEIAQRKLNAQPIDLLTRGDYAAWVEALHAAGRKPDYMVFGTLTSSRDPKEMRYTVRLKMVRVQGENTYETVANESGTVSVPIKKR